uniref:Uncharacterized protein n=1 Tax=Oryza glumipatula TaxID=40148 RepID=A0A0D9YJW0_9ORYZ
MDKTNHRAPPRRSLCCSASACLCCAVCVAFATIHGGARSRCSLLPGARRRERYAVLWEACPCIGYAGSGRLAAAAAVHGRAGRRAAEHERAHPGVRPAALPLRRHAHHRRPRRRRPRRALPTRDGVQQSDNGRERGLRARRRRRRRGGGRRAAGASGGEGGSSCCCCSAH